MSVSIDQLAFGLRRITPQQEHDRPGFGRDGIHHGARELLPAESHVTAGVAAPNGQDGVEEQDAMLGPRDQRSPIRDLNCDIGMKFLQNVA